MPAQEGNTTAQKGKEARSARLEVRIEPARREAWKGRAAAEGLSLADWLFRQIDG